MCNKLFLVMRNYFTCKTGYMQREMKVKDVRLYKSQNVNICLWVN